MALPGQEPSVFSEDVKDAGRFWRAEGLEAGLRLGELDKSGDVI